MMLSFCGFLYIFSSVYLFSMYSGEITRLWSTVVKKWSLMASHCNISRRETIYISIYIYIYIDIFFFGQENAQIGWQLVELNYS